MCCADRRGMDGICMSICWRSNVTLNAVDSLSFTPVLIFTHWILFKTNTHKLLFITLKHKQICVISIVWHHTHVLKIMKNRQSSVNNITELHQASSMLSSLLCFLPDVDHFSLALLHTGPQLVPV